MAHTIAEIELTVRRVFEDSEPGSVEGLHAQVTELKFLLEELWTLPGVESLNLRRAVRVLIDQAHRRDRFADRVA